MDVDLPMLDLRDVFKKAKEMQDDSMETEEIFLDRSVFESTEEEDIPEDALRIINAELDTSPVDLVEEWQNCKKEFEVKDLKFGRGKNNEEDTIPEIWKNTKFLDFSFPDVDFLNDHWQQIKDGVISVLTVGKIPNDPDNRLITRAISKVARDNRCEELMKRVKSIMAEYIPKIFEEVINCKRTEAISDIAYKNWSDFKLKMAIMDRIFYPVNGRCGNRVMFPVRPISTAIVMHVFTDEIELMKSVSGGLIHLVNTHRLTREIDGDKLKFLIGMFNELRCYESVFEPILEKETEKFYQMEASKKFAELDLPGYVDYCNDRIAEENHRAESLLSPSSKQKLFRVLRKCMVEDYATMMVDKGADALFDGEKEEDIKKLYKILDNCKDGHNSLKMCFANYVKKMGKVLISDDSRDKTLVDDLLTFKSKLDSIIKDCFNSNEKFVQAEKDAFSYFINTKPNKPAELIAKYMDIKMKAVNKSFTEKEFENLMDRVIVLFRFIQGKDVFEAFYKRDLAKRLILGKSASVDAEKSMLVKLKCECGPAFTSKLEGMFRDIEVSRDIQSNFKSHIEKLALGKLPVEFNVNVLTMGFWPNYTPMDVHIPAQLCEFQQTFNDYYIERNKGRKLTWQYSLANALMIANFKKGKKELDVSLFQALVLFMYNDKDSFTFLEILNYTKIEEKELIRTLLSLVGKTPILTRTKGEKAKISHDEVFSFNDEFTDKNYKIRISQVQMRETEKEKEQTEEEIQQDRIYVIDANIVRLMKQHQTMVHNNLITQLISQLRFNARPQDLKKRIESLIERDYMARDEKDPQLYKYVA